MKLTFLHYKTCFSTFHDLLFPFVCHEWPISLPYFFELSEYTKGMERGRIPNRLRRYRRMAGYSQKTVAKAIGLLGTSSLSRWEKGTSLPTLPVVFKLSLLYKTHPIHLYQDLWQELKFSLESGPNLSSPSEGFSSNQAEYLWRNQLWPCGPFTVLSTNSDRKTFQNSNRSG